LSITCIGFFWKIEFLSKSPSLTPVFAGNAFAERGFSTGGINDVPPVSLPFSLVSTPVIKNVTPKGRVTGGTLFLPSRASMSVNRRSPSENGRKGG
jgi:hypothetical protein